MTMATAELLVSLFWKYASRASAVAFLDSASPDAFAGEVALTADVFSAT
jgi:hypothetical protein